MCLLRCVFPGSVLDWPKFRPWLAHRRLATSHLWLNIINPNLPQSICQGICHLYKIFMMSITLECRYPLQQTNGRNVKIWIILWCLHIVQNETKTVKYTYIHNKTGRCNFVPVSNQHFGKFHTFQWEKNYNWRLHLLKCGLANSFESDVFFNERTAAISLANLITYD